MGSNLACGPDHCHCKCGDDEDSEIDNRRQVLDSHRSYNEYPEAEQWDPSKKDGVPAALPSGAVLAPMRTHTCQSVDLGLKGLVMPEERGAPSPSLTEQLSQEGVSIEQTTAQPNSEAEEKQPGVAASAEATQIGAPPKKRKDPKEVAKTPFPKRPMMCKLSQKSWDTLKNLFMKMDVDGLNLVSRENAADFFQSFKKVNTEAMFNEVDTDKSGAIDATEFMDFWIQVKASGYSEDQILEEIDQIMDGGTWVDWKDGRNTDKNSFSFPKRPLFCKISGKTWKSCEALFMKISGGNGVITRSQASSFFKGAFAQVSVDAMFNEVDIRGHGAVVPQDFMAFWIQVKGHGYTEKEICDELELMMEGGSWVDWKDSRQT